MARRLPPPRCSDDKRAEVVGERTYGDASMRKAITMEDGSAVILSVAKYYSPTRQGHPGHRRDAFGAVARKTEPVVVRR